MADAIESLRLRCELIDAENDRLRTEITSLHGKIAQCEERSDKHRRAAKELTDKIRRLQDSLSAERGNASALRKSQAQAAAKAKRENDALRFAMDVLAD